MWYLYDHLQPGSFKPIYADTDSMCLALSRSRFGNTDDLEDLHRGLYEPIVKEEMRDSWNKSFKEWFVTTRDARDEKRPGKWKRKSQYNINHVIWTISHIIFKLNFGSRRARLSASPRSATLHLTKKMGPQSLEPRVCLDLVV